MKNPAARSRIARGLVRTIVVLVVAGFTTAAGAQGRYLGTLFTGLYSAQGEAGSGVTMTHEEPVIFLTFYLYRGDRSPYWLTATVTRAPDLHGDYNYTGDLYETSGPPYGGPFDPTMVTYRKVGTVSLVSVDGYTVDLNYTIDGVSISKVYTRFTLNDLNFAGPYWGTIVYTTGSCSSPQSFAISGSTTVAQSSNALTIVLRGPGSTCTLSGDYRQSGSLGGSSGTLSCSDGTSGPMALVGLQMTQTGFTGSFELNVGQCNLPSAITGIRVEGP